MDPRTLLEHAVFQLTPTRTRCDLLVVSSMDGSTEKIASGLVEPFLSHLRSARDQIPRGGYSFSLRPPTNTTGNAAWFTRGTVQRFVGFVATPEILERLVTIENEIVHIEDEIDRTHISEASGENSKYALLLVLENRKKILQKEQGMAYARASIAGYEKSHIDDLVMFADAFGASRLREACISFKELCAEKEKDKLWVDELAALEASGHSQLSSVQSSGIMLTSEIENNIPLEQTNTAPNGMSFTTWNQGQHVPTNGDASQSKHQVPMGWMPEYMYGFHGPMGPNSAPFQGYAYPGMQFIPPYSIHSSNSQWHSHDEEFNNSNDRDVDNHIVHKHSESRSESDDGGSFDKNQQQRKSNKKSSRKVVIRNINYISKGRQTDSDESEESSVDDDFVDEDFLRRKVEDIVGSFEKHKSSNRHHNRKKNGKQNLGVSNGSSDVINKNMDNVATDKKSDDSWGSFQNILMRDESSVQDLDQKRIRSADDKNQQHIGIVDEYCTIKSNSFSRSSTYDYQQLDDGLGKGSILKMVEDDPIVVNGRHISSDGGMYVKNFECDDNYNQSIKRVQNDKEEFLLTQRNTPVVATTKDFSNCIDETTAIRTHEEGDWFVAMEYQRKSFSEAGDYLTFEADLIQNSEDHNSNEKRIEDAVFDDSVVVPERSSAGGQSFSLLETDMSIISGLAVAAGSTKTSNQPKGYVGSDFNEPDDLQMLFGRDSIAKPVSISWTPEVDYSADIAHTSASEKNSLAEPDSSTIDEKPGKKNKTQANNNAKLSNNDKKPRSLYGSLTKSKSEVLMRNRKLSNMNREAIQRSKAQTEEENRKRLEELMIERQKRIAQRSVNSSTTAASKQSKADVKTVTNSSRPEKKISQSKTQETKSMGMETLQISQHNKQNGLSHVTKIHHPTGTIRKI